MMNKLVFDMITVTCFGIVMSIFVGFAFATFSLAWLNFEKTDLWKEILKEKIKGKNDYE